MNLLVLLIDLGHFGIAECFLVQGRGSDGAVVTVPPLGTPRRNGVRRQVQIAVGRFVVLASGHFDLLDLENMLRF